MSDGDNSPRCPVATFPPGIYYEFLSAHQFAWENIQAMLFWRRPIHMGVLLGLVQLCFLCACKLKLGVFSIVALCFAIHRLWILAGKKISSLIEKCFQSEYNKGKEESNHIYEDPMPFSERFSHMSSTFYDWIMKRWKLVKDGNQTAVFQSLLVWVGLFLLFSVTGTLLPVWIFVDLLLLTPGLIFHPQINPYVWPYMMKFAAAIKCPYCNAGKRD